MSLMPFFIVWAILGVVVVILALMRRNASEHEDDSIHLSGGEAAAEQATIAKKLAWIDKWGKLLTIVLVVTGLILAILYGIQVWEETSRVGLK